MIHTGLVSVTFRPMTPEAIVELVARAGLEAIEWGGDIHVPHGDIARAGRVRELTEKARLKVAAYGSYCHLDDEQKTPFAAVIDSAVALGAPVIRVWAGSKPSAEADEEHRAMVVRQSRRLADMAAGHGIGIAYEYHGHTLTDTRDSALRLLRDVGHPNVGTYWQPDVAGSAQQHAGDLRAMLPWVSNVHVFNWLTDGRRMPLADGAAEWRTFLAILAETGRDHYAMLEFVPDDSAESFLRDAAVLKELCGDY